MSSRPVVRTPRSTLPHRNDNILGCYMGGMKVAEIAGDLSLTKHMVRRVLRERGIDFKDHTFDPGVHPMWEGSADYRRRATWERATQGAHDRRFELVASLPPRAEHDQ